MSNAIIREARSWIGTPYVHQASAKEAGCDCLGLIRGVWRAVIGTEPEVPPPYSQDWSEPQGNEDLWSAAARHLRQKSPDEVAAGDLLLFRMRSGAVAKHVGLAAEIGASPTFIHSYSGHGVVESALTRPWQRRIVARFAMTERVD